METYLAILFIYWGLNIIFSIIQKYLEVRISSKY
jgi:putative amino-acid transport system permease protein